MIVILMGVAGAGKTTVGRALAHRLGWAFVDADDLHPLPNIEKMSRSQPLDDRDRAPWLAKVQGVLKEASDRGADLVVACSALRERYRSELVRDVVGVRWIFLRAGRAVLHARLSMHHGHFAGPGLLDSQLAVLEVPVDALTVDADQLVTAQVDEICRGLGLLRSTGGG